MLNKLFEKFQQTYSPFDSSLATFNQPNIKELEKILELEALAEKNGKANRPSKTAKQKDAVSKSIDHAMNIIINSGKEGLINYFSGAKGLSATQSQSTTQQSETTLNRSLSELQEEAKKGVIELFPLKSNVIRGEQALRDFRKKNKLKRNAEEPPSLAMGWGWIVLAALVETGINAFTLSDAHPDGLFGVGLEVLFFTICNMGIALILGTFFVRQLHHINSIRQFIFGPIVALTSLLIFVLNLSFAHYRDALLVFSRAELSDSDFFTQAPKVFGNGINNLLENPFALSDPKSFLLFILGCLLAFVAAYKAYRLDDPYPGYGKLNKQQLKQTEDYLLLVSDFFEELSDIAERGVKKLEEITLLGEGAKRQISQRSLDNEKLIAKYQSWLQMVESCGQSLYATYRELNESFRTEASPKCFNIEYSLPKDASKINFGSKQKTKSPGSVSNQKRINTLYKALADYREHFKTLENLSPEGKLLDQTDKSLNAIDKLGQKYTKTN